MGSCNQPSWIIAQDPAFLGLTLSATTYLASGVVCMFR